MTFKIINKNDIIIPKEFAEFLSGDKIKISKTNSGILLSDIEESIKKARGILKGILSTKEYFLEKEKEKKFEN